MFHSTALCPEDGCQGNADQEERKEEGEEGSPVFSWAPWAKILACGWAPSWTSQSKMPVQAIACQSQGLRRIEAASLSSFPDAYSLSIVAKCLLLLPSPAPTYLWNQLHFLRLLESLHKGMGRREQTWGVSGAFRKSLHFPLCLFTSLLLSSFLESISHNFSNFVIVFPEMTYKGEQNPREDNAPKISTTFA